MANRLSNGGLMRVPENGWVCGNSLRFWRREMVPESETAAESVGRSRRYLQRFSAAVGLRLGFLRQRRGVEKSESFASRAEQPLAIGGESHTAEAGLFKGKEL